MTIIDRGCWERGCACYDSRIADETVDVVEKREWVGLTKKEFQEAVEGLEDLEDCWVAIEAKLRSKND